MPGGQRCAVAICKNTSKTQNENPDRNILFHRFPKDKQIASIWIQKCQRRRIFNEDHARMCSEHFTEEDYVRNLQAELLGIPYRKRLKQSAIPSLKLSIEEAELIPKQKRKRRKRAQVKATKKSKTSEASISEAVKSEPQEIEFVSVEDIAPASPEPLSYKQKYEDLLKKYEIVVNENTELKNQLQENERQIRQHVIKIAKLKQDIINIQGTLKIENTNRNLVETALNCLLGKAKMQIVKVEKK